MPSGVEQYGITYGLDAVTLGRLETGFDEIRAIEGWEDFRIPHYVWEYVGQTERDRFLTWLQTALWTTRTGDLPSSVSKSMHLALCYALFVWAEWWRDTPNVDKETPVSMYALVVSDCGVPSAALGTLSTYATTDISGYWSISHPSEETALDIPTIGFENYPPESWDDIYCWVRAGSVASAAYLDYDADTDDETYCLLEDKLTEIIDYDANWNDLGTVESWPMLVNGAYEIISGRVSYRNFGLMDGSIEIVEALTEGTAVQVHAGSVIRCSGIVTGSKNNLVDGTYSVNIADPVTAGGGAVEYTAGDAIDALEESIEAHGGVFETVMTTTETVFFAGDPLDAWQFFRSVCYAVEGVLQYGRDGVYRLIAAGAGHTVTDDDVIGDDRPTVEIRTADYKNRVAVSVDAEWQEDVTTGDEVTETFTGGGGTASITRLGEQVLEQSVDFSGGEGGTDIEYEYDASGYRTTISEAREGASSVGSEKVTRKTVFSNITEGGNKYEVSILAKTYRYEYSPISDTYGWIQNKETSEEWKVNLGGLSTVIEIEKGNTAPIGGTMNKTYTIDGVDVDIPTLIPLCVADLPGDWPYLWNQHRWIASVVSNPTAGPLEGSMTCTHYIWAPKSLDIENSWFCSHMGWIRSSGQADKSYTPPKLEVYAAKETYEVHILAKAEDPNSITSLGVHEYETSAVALDTETGMQAMALGVLYEKSRIRQAGIAVALSEILPHDSVIWRGLEWNVESVSVDLGKASDDLEIATQSTLSRLSGALSKEPVTWVEDMKNVLGKRLAQYDNISRGKIIAQTGFRRYTVQPEGHTESIEAKALTDDPVLVGGSVLLVKPTGKSQPWTLLTLSKEQEILLPATVQEAITPDDDGAPGIKTFWADAYVTGIDETRTLFWVFDTLNYEEAGVIVDPGDGGTPFEVPGEGFPDPGEGSPLNPATCTYIFRTVGDISPTITPFRGTGVDRPEGDPVALGGEA